MKFSRFSLATLVALAALTPFASVVAHAQKPALTENIDERGRVPYHSNFSTDCPSDTCTFAFRSVPAGYRLVVTHASVQYTGNPAPSFDFNYAFLGGGATAPGETASYIEYLPAPESLGAVVGGIPRYLASSPVTYYVEPLNTPNMAVNNVLAGSIVVGSISGYLVAIN